MTISYLVKRFLLKLRRNYKSRLFCKVFSEKRNALSLYNAINGTKYEDPEELKIVTLEDTVFIHMKNDISILFDDRLSLWEHQSTLNRNMPLRGLMYYARNMEGILDEPQRRRLYGKSIVKIPTPEYYVFYNGEEDAPDRVELRLSDAFQIPAEGYEWTAHMLNINSGHNDELMNRCPALKGLAFLIQRTREYKDQGLPEGEAAD